MVSAANLNSPDQVVIAGHAGAVNRAVELAKAAGARRAVLLPVSAPFHCALMRPAQERLRADLDATEFRDLACPLVNNWQAREIRTGAEAREGLYQQVPNPVRWMEGIRYLAARGVARCVEVGAGGVLTGLLRGIDPSLKGLKFGEPADLEKLRDKHGYACQCMPTFRANRTTNRRYKGETVEHRGEQRSLSRVAAARDVRHSCRRADSWIPSWIGVRRTPFRCRRCHRRFYRRVDARRGSGDEAGESRKGRVAGRQRLQRR